VGYKTMTLLRFFRLAEVQQKLNAKEQAFQLDKENLSLATFKFTDF